MFQKVVKELIIEKIMKKNVINVSLVQF